MTSFSFGHEIKLLLKVLVGANVTVMNLTNKKWTLIGKQEKSPFFTPLTEVSGILWTGWKYKSWIIEKSSLSVTRCKLSVLVIRDVSGWVKFNGCTNVVYVSEKLKCSEHLSSGIIRLTNGSVLGQTYWRYIDPCKKIATEKFLLTLSDKFEKIEDMVIQVLLKQQIFSSNKNAYLIIIL